MITDIVVSALDLAGHFTSSADVRGLTAGHRRLVRTAIPPATTFGRVMRPDS